MTSAATAEHYYKDKRRKRPKNKMMMRNIGFTVVVDRAPLPFQGSFSEQRALVCAPQT